MKKKIYITMLVIFGVVGFALPTKAGALQYYFSYELDPNVNSGVKYSPVNTKDDNDVYAHIYTTNHNIISQDLFYYRVVASAAKGREACSPFKQITPSNAAYTTIKYYDGYAWAGAERCLRLDTDKWIVRAAGWWWS